MKNVLLISLLLLLISCGRSPQSAQNCAVNTVDGGTEINCGQGPVFIPDGQDGDNGSDGKDAVLLTKSLLPAGACQEVYPGIYAQNISSGNIFDIYLSDDCLDSSGMEQCDNVNTTRGDSGSVSPGQGSGTVCWVDNIQFSGVKQNNNDILIYILNFGGE